MKSALHNNPPAKKNFILVANWKMHGSREKSVALLQGLVSALKASPKEYDSVFFVICPPATLLIPCSDLLQGLDMPIILGAQNVHWEEKGAFTGEISVSLLKDAGARAVIIGHSERRQGGHGETNQRVAQKGCAVLQGGLIPIICVGEEDSIRKKGDQEAYVAHQIDESLPDKNILTQAPLLSPTLPKLLVAYEPCWAIGTGCVPTDEDHHAMTRVITQRLAAHYEDQRSHCAVLYGGSVTPKTIHSIRNTPIEGVLVGGASLILDDFLAIARACAAVR
jgi:triosephosphate isomerase